jgi:hypothetical protein
VRAFCCSRRLPLHLYIRRIVFVTFVTFCVNGFSPRRGRRRVISMSASVPASPHWGALTLSCRCTSLRANCLGSIDVRSRHQHPIRHDEHPSGAAGGRVDSWTARRPPFHNVRQPGRNPVRACDHGGGSPSPRSRSGGRLAFLQHILGPRTACVGFDGTTCRTTRKSYNIGGYVLQSAAEKGKQSCDFGFRAVIDKLFTFDRRTVVESRINISPQSRMALS